MTKLYILKQDRGFWKNLFGRRLYKVGITSGDPHKRAASIADSGMKNRVLFSLPFVGAGWLEKRLHRTFRPLNRPGKGSGKTEWFALGFFGAVLLQIVLFALFVLQIALAISLLFFILQSFAK